MARALQLAERGLYTADPNPRVGCVLVSGDRILAEGWHRRAGGPHAEIEALNQAQQARQSVRDCTAYITLEPCAHQGRTPPCVDSLIQAGVARVVAAMQDPNPRVNGRGLERLRQAGIETNVGLMEAQARALNPGFISRMARGRPYVRLKQAMSLDGRTALRSGESRWITSEYARLDVHRLRARSSAVMTGINTILADDPALNVRLESLAATGELQPALSDIIRQPLRVVLDSKLKIPLNARLLKLPGDLLIVTTIDDQVKRDVLVSEHVEIVTLPADAAGRPELRDVMSVLAEGQINEVLVESGSILAGALLSAQLVDEIILYVAPCILGDSARGLFSIPMLSDIKARLTLNIEDTRQIGQDFRIIAKPVFGES